MSQPGSLSFRVCLFFAVNPDEELYSSDISAKFGGPTTDVCKRLQAAVDDGFLKRVAMRVEGEPTRMAFTAGPALMAATGRAA